MARCDHCGHDAVTFVRYNGSHLCAYHFKNYIERRVKKEIRKQISLNPGDVIGVAVSGGKDSMVTLSILNDVFKERRDLSIVAISIDEGIEGYRPPSLDIVREYCKENDIEHRVRAFSEFELRMDDISSITGDSSPCTYCGVFRRQLMNDEARKVNARYLATGHNLDDNAQSILMNFVRGDVERLARLGPHTKVQPGLIPRFLPLRMISEAESLLYAIVSGIPYWDGICPYYEEALRNQYRDVIDRLDHRSPDAKFGIVSSYDALKPMLIDGMGHSKMRICECGEPTLGEFCKACELKGRLRERLGK